jgi:S-adenosyl methyltransferase
MTGPTPFNPNVPSIARTYDYLLGGKDNYPVDREIGEIFIKQFPGAVQIALDNRKALIRAVDFMARDLGVTQFLDLGSGLPTADNVHQVAQRANLTARVVYVDNDPIVLAHGRALLAENEFTVVVKGDVREPEKILMAKETNALIDFSRPVGVIASAILHHIVDAEDPLGIVAAVCDAVPAGSYLFISHFRTLGDPDSAALEEVMFQAFGRGAWRTNAQIAQYFEAAELLTPGVVPCAQWRPESDPGELSTYQRLVVAGLGRKVR